MAASQSAKVTISLLGQTEGVWPSPWHLKHLLIRGTRLSLNINSCCHIHTSNLSSKLMFKLMVEPDVFWGVCLDWVWEQGFRQGSELALTPNMMYLLSVQDVTKFKSESLNPRENTIMEKPRESGTQYDGVRHQTCEGGMELRIKGF